MGERLLWPEEFSTKRIVQDPASAAPLVVDETLARLDKVVSRFPGSGTAARAQILRGDIYHSKGKFDLARKEFEKAAQTYPAFPSLVIGAYRRIALTYEKQEAWEGALKTYRNLFERYSSDPRVLDVPLQMVNLARAGALDAGQAVFKEAVGHYQQVLKSSSNPTIVFMARQLLVDCYVRTSHWKEAMGELENLVFLYPGRKEVPRWMKMVDEIGRNRLNDPQGAHSLASRYAEKYPARRRVVESWLKSPPSTVASVP